MHVRFCALPAAVPEFEADEAAAADGGGGLSLPAVTIAESLQRVLLFNAAVASIRAQHSDAFMPSLISAMAAYQTAKTHLHYARARRRLRQQVRSAARSMRSEMRRGDVPELVRACQRCVVRAAAMLVARDGVQEG